MRFWRKISAGLELIQLLTQIRQLWVTGGSQELLAATAVGSKGRAIVDLVDRGIQIVRVF